MRLKQVVKSLLYPLYERRIYRQLDFAQTPAHIGVILDGNRRWSKDNPAIDGDISTARGHQAGAEKIIDLLNWAEAAQVKVITLWLLSNQNLGRSPEELKPLLDIIGNTVSNLAKKGRWKLRPVGSLEILPLELKEILDSAAMATRDTPGMVVNVAIGYGGRNEIVDAVKSLILEGAKAGKTPEALASEVNIDEISKYLYTAGLPDPDLVIRTSGEQRLGGFLLWQSAHSEFYFCEAYWPDFRKLDFLRALRSYATRNRRHGI